MFKCVLVIKKKLNFSFYLGFEENLKYPKMICILKWWFVHIKLWFCVHEKDALVMCKHSSYTQFFHCNDKQADISPFDLKKKKKS